MNKWFLQDLAKLLKDHGLDSEMVVLLGGGEFTQEDIDNARKEGFEEGFSDGENGSEYF